MRLFQPHSSVHRLLPRAASRPVLPRAASQPVLARAGAPRERPRRSNVTFLIPGQGPIVFDEVTQRSLINVLDKLGAIGFVREDGRCSQDVSNLPEGATVKLVLPEEVPVAQQVRNLQRSLDNQNRGKEVELQKFLYTVASQEHPGAAVTVLPTAPFRGAKGQDFVQIDAGVLAGDTLYLGEAKQVLSGDSLSDLVSKFIRIRLALVAGTSPDLSTALQGVSRVVLVLGGEVLQEGLHKEVLLKMATTSGISVVMPSGQRLGFLERAAIQQL